MRAAIPEAQDLSGYLTTEAATATYATKADVEGVRSAIPARSGPVFVPDHHRGLLDPMPPGPT